MKIINLFMIMLLFFSVNAFASDSDTILELKLETKNAYLDWSFEAQRIKMESIINTFSSNDINTDNLDNLYNNFLSKNGERDKVKTQIGLLAIVSDMRNIQFEFMTLSAQNLIGRVVLGNSLRTNLRNDIEANSANLNNLKIVAYEKEKSSTLKTHQLIVRSVDLGFLTLKLEGYEINNNLNILYRNLASLELKINSAYNTLISTNQRNEVRQVKLEMSQITQEIVYEISLILEEPLLTEKQKIEILIRSTELLLKQNNLIINDLEVSGIDTEELRSVSLALEESFDLLKVKYYSGDLRGIDTYVQVFYENLNALKLAYGKVLRSEIDDSLNIRKSLISDLIDEIRTQITVNPIYIIEGSVVPEEIKDFVRFTFENFYTARLSEDLYNFMKESGYTIYSPNEFKLPPIRDIINGTIDDRELRKTPTNQVPWGIKAVYGDQSSFIPSGGEGIKVAIIDSGISRNHPDLKNRISGCTDLLYGYPRDNLCDDFNGHGTHVAGTIAADGGDDKKGIYGVAPAANLYIYRVCYASGSCSSDAIIKAIDEAAKKGVNIISMSLGSFQEDIYLTQTIKKYPNILFISAAGNEGPGANTIGYPASNIEVVAVSAVDSSFNTASFSSRGLNNNNYIVENREIEFAAPGVNILSTWLNGNYGSISGTSMATPHVSGIAAKNWQGSAQLTREYLQGIAKKYDIGPAGDDKETGFGFLKIN